MHKITAEKLNQLIKDNTLDVDELKSYSNILRENSEKSSQQMNTSYFTFLVISLTWVLLKLSLIKNVSFYEFDFKNIDLVLLFLPLLSAFTFYKSVSLLLIRTYIEEVLSEYYCKIYPNLHSLDSTYLLSFPSFDNFDNFIHSGSKTIVSIILNKLWLLFLVCFFYITPILLICWMICTSFCINSLISISIGVINSFFLIRIIHISLNTGYALGDE